MIATLLVFATIFFVALLMFAFEPVHVPDGHVAVLERFGRFVRVLEPGTHLIFRPIHALRFTSMLVESERRNDATRSDTRTVLHRMIPTTRQTYDPPEWTMTSGEGLTLRVNVVLFYRVVDARAASYRSSNYVTALRESVRESLANFVSGERFEEVRKRLHGGSSALLTLIDEAALAELGLVVDELRLQHLGVPERVSEGAVDAFVTTRRLAAEREAAAAEHANALKRLEQEHELEKLQLQHERATRIERAGIDAEVLAAFGERDLHGLAAWRAAGSASSWSVVAK